MEFSPKTKRWLSEVLGKLNKGRVSAGFSQLLYSHGLPESIKKEINSWKKPIIVAWIRSQQEPLSCVLNILRDTNKESTLNIIMPWLLFGLGLQRTTLPDSQARDVHDLIPRLKPRNQLRLAAVLNIDDYTAIVERWIASLGSEEGKDREPIPAAAKDSGPFTFAGKLFSPDSGPQQFLTEVVSILKGLGYTRLLHKIFVSDIDVGLGPVTVVVSAESTILSARFLWTEIAQQCNATPRATDNGPQHAIGPSSVAGAKMSILYAHLLDTIRRFSQVSSTAPSAGSDKPSTSSSASSLNPSNKSAKKEEKLKARSQVIELCAETIRRQGKEPRPETFPAAVSAVLDIDEIPPFVISTLGSSVYKKARRGRGTLRKLLEFDGKDSVVVADYEGKVVVGVIDPGPTPTQETKQEEKGGSEHRAEQAPPSSSSLVFSVEDTLDTLYPPHAGGYSAFLEDLKGVFLTLEELVFNNSDNSIPLPSLAYSVSELMGYEAYARCMSAVCLAPPSELATLTDSPSPEALPPHWSPLEKLILVVCPEWLCIEGQAKVWRRSFVEGVLSSIAGPEEGSVARHNTPFHLRALPFESISPEQWMPQAIRLKFEAFASRVRAGLVVRGTSEPSMSDTEGAFEGSADGGSASWENEQGPIDVGDERVGEEGKSASAGHEPSAVSPTGSAEEIQQGKDTLPQEEPNVSTPAIASPQPEATAGGAGHEDAEQSRKISTGEWDAPFPTSIKLVQGEALELSEGSDIEFKLSVRLDQVPRYASAFLNSGGGALVFGVDDDGVIRGLHLDRKRRDEVVCSIDQGIRNIQPFVSTELFDVQFPPVYPSKEAEEHKDTHLVVVLFGRPCASDAVVYATSNREVYVRRRASTHLLRDWEIVDFMNRKIAAANREIYNQLLASRAATTSATPDKGDMGDSCTAAEADERKGEEHKGEAGAVVGDGGEEQVEGPSPGEEHSVTVAKEEGEAPPDANEVANLVRVPTEQGNSSGQKTTVHVVFGNGVEVGAVGERKLCDFTVRLQQVATGGHRAKLMIGVQRINPVGKLAATGAVAEGACVLSVDGRSTEGWSVKDFIKRMRKARRAVFLTPLPAPELVQEGLPAIADARPLRKYGAKEPAMAEAAKPGLTGATEAQAETKAERPPVMTGAEGSSGPTEGTASTREAAGQASDGSGRVGSREDGQAPWGGLEGQRLHKGSFGSWEEAEEGGYPLAFPRGSSMQGYGRLANPGIGWRGGMGSDSVGVGSSRDSVLSSDVVSYFSAGGKKEGRKARRKSRG